MQVKSLSTALLSHGRKAGIKPAPSASFAGGGLDQQVGTECYSRCLSDILMKARRQVRETVADNIAKYGNDVLCMHTSQARSS